MGNKNCRDTKNRKENILCSVFFCDLTKVYLHDFLLRLVVYVSFFSSSDEDRWILRDRNQSGIILWQRTREKFFLLLEIMLRLNKWEQKYNLICVIKG